MISYYRQRGNINVNIKYLYRVIILEKYMQKLCMKYMSNFSIWQYEVGGFLFVDDYFGM